MASNRCPNCSKGFQTLADEVGSHECPHCGASPGGSHPFEVEEDEDDTPSGLYANKEEEEKGKELMEKEESYEKHWRDE